MAGETIDAYPSPVNVVVHPLRDPQGQPSAIDVINTSNVAITTVDLSVPFFTDPDRNWTLRVPPCEGQSLCFGAPFAVEPGMSRPVGFRCPRQFTPGDIASGQLTVTAHFANGEMATDTVMINCEAPLSQVAQIFSENVVFMTTQVNTTSTTTIKVTSNYVMPVTVQVDSTQLDQPNFGVITCQPPCQTTSAIDAMVGVSCHPTTPGPHFTFLEFVGSSGQRSESVLICTGTTNVVPQPDGVPVDGDGVPVNGDGVPIDAPNIGPGGPGNNNGDPTSFYACSATAVAGLVPIVFAIVLASLRRRRRA